MFFYNFLIQIFKHLEEECVSYKVVCKRHKFWCKKMARDIIKNWDSSSRETVVSFSRISGHVRSPSPIKERINKSIMRLKVQEGKIENSLMKLQRHDKNLFNKCVTARIGKDSARAAMYASECAEIRKMAKTTLGCQLALEKAVIRLENILIHGESLNAMGPVAEVVKAIKSQIGGIMPDISYELGQVMENLNETAMEMGEVTSQPYDEVTPTAEAQKILTEASAVADQRMNEKFPDLPTSVESPVRARFEEPGSSQ